MAEEKRRYVGIDLGKCEYTTTIIGLNGRIAIHKGMTMEKGQAAIFLRKSPKPSCRTKGLSLNNICLTKGNKGTCEHKQTKVA